MPRSKLPAKNISWTANLAYAVGLLVTDGCLSNDGRHIILRSKDKEQLENFKRCLDVKNQITANNKKKLNGELGVYYRIQVGDVGLYRWLLSIGLFPAKTYSIGSINVPDEYFRDFLRGHLDGDGCITIYKDYYNTRLHPEYIYTRIAITFLSASRVHIVWLRDRIYSLISIRGDLFEKKDNRPNTVGVWYLKFMKKDSIKLIPLLYYSSTIPSLTRKKEKAFTAMNIIGRVVRKKYERRVMLDTESFI